VPSAARHAATDDLGALAYRIKAPQKLLLVMCPETTTSYGLSTTGSSA
jgi:hypothetical protein